MSTKAALRAEMKAKRDAMSPDEAAKLSRVIHKRLLDAPEIAAAQSFFIYVSMGAEAATRELIADLLALGRRVAAPKVAEAGVMSAVVINDLNELKPSALQIPEPPDVNSPAVNPQIVIAPGLAFTQHGERLGRGGGYYDRYLARGKPKQVVGLAYDWQIVDHLPTDQHDQRVSMIVTPTRVIRVVDDSIAN